MLSGAGVEVGKHQEPSKGSVAIFALLVHWYTEQGLFALREKKPTQPL